MTTETITSEAQVSQFESERGLLLTVLVMVLLGAGSIFLMSV